CFNPPVTPAFYPLSLHDASSDLLLRCGDAHRCAPTSLMASRYLEPEIERRSRAAMTRWQAGRLREQVRHPAAHSPFYRRKSKARPEEHKSEPQSLAYLLSRLLPE